MEITEQQCRVIHYRNESISIKRRKKKKKPIDSQTFPSSLIDIHHEQHEDNSYTVGEY